MKHLIALSLAVMGLQACTNDVPASNAGYGDYADARLEQQRRDAALRGTTVGPGIVGVPISNEPRSAVPSVTTQPIGTAVPVAGAAGATAATGATGATSATGATGADIYRRSGVQASPSNAAPQLAGTRPAGLSDEQSFDAVTSRETIESDAQRRAANAAAYQVVQPTALPTRTGDAGPNIVSYALQTTNLRGQKVHSRVYTREGTTRRNCAKYPSPDAAQRAFLSSGGPARDREGIDPDGDGFACAWDPAPFRTAARSAPQSTAPAVPVPSASEASSGSTTAPAN